MMRGWHGYLSVARCKWFIYCPADTTPLIKIQTGLTFGLHKPCTGHTGRTSRTGQCMNHTPAILAASAIYCIHGHIIHQAGAVKLSKMLMKNMHHPHRLQQQTRIDHRTALIMARISFQILGEQQLKEH